MKRLAFILIAVSLSCFGVSCSAPDFSETIVLTDEPDPADPDDPNDPNDPNDPGGGGDPNDPDPELEYPVSCNGLAGPFPCSGYDLIGWASTGSFGASLANDCWGWTDPDSGKEYAIYGLENGTAFVDISDPSNLVFTAKVISSSNSTWRDIKVYNNYAYIVSEAPNYGMQVFDLTHLRDTTILPAYYEADNTYHGFSNAHNIVINEETGFAYAVGTDTYGGGPHFIDLQDPANPVAAGGYPGYSHDAQAVIYNGPDTDYTGREIYIGSNEDHIEIVDVTDKNNPVFIASATYTGATYTHQAWLTEDHRYLLVGDEVDEIDFGFNTKTIIFDLANLDSPEHLFNYSGTNSSIDHNGYVKGNLYYLASYTAGLRVIDISDIANSSMNEVGYFDVSPPDDNAIFDGAWSVYPYFESGNIVISDMVSGLFIVKQQ